MDKKHDLYDTLTLVTTIAGVVFVAASTGVAAYNAWLVNGQLKEMKSSDSVSLSQARAAQSIANTAGRQLDVAKRLADDAGIQAAAATAQVRQMKLSVVAANSAVDAARAQLKEIIAEQRPWIDINGPPTLVGNLVFFKGFGGELEMQLPIRAFGPRPAYHVVAIARLINRYLFEPLDDQEELCKAPNAPLRKDERRVEMTVLNDDRYELPVTALMSPKYLQQMKQTGQSRARLAVTGCVLYAERNGTWHRTGFIYDIYKAGGSSGRVQAIDVSGPQIPADELIWRLDELGNGPAD